MTITRHTSVYKADYTIEKVSKQIFSVYNSLTLTEKNSDFEGDGVKINYLMILMPISVY